LNKRPKFATTINRDLRSLDDLPAQFKAMGLSSTLICMPTTGKQVQARRWTRQGSFTTRPTNSGIYRSPKEEPEKFNIQKFFSGILGGKNATVCY
jgi:hypothetical protein